MEFIYPNYVDTTTSIVVDSNTITVKNILNPDKTFQYKTQGANDDSIPASITYNFDLTSNVDRIILKGINLKDFNIFYDGLTANTFAIQNGATTVADFSSNSESSMYIRTSTIACSSVTIDMNKTFVADSEKAVGYFSTSRLQLDFPQLPPAKGYKPNAIPKETVHKLSDGGTRLHHVDDKWNVKIKMKNIDESFRNDLKSVWELHRTIAFTAFGTMTGWDEISFPCVWPGKFDWYTYSDSAVAPGFSGSIDLREV